MHHSEFPFKTKLSIYFFVMLAPLLVLNSCNKERKTDDWINLFNGKDLSHWKANESPESFKVVDGVIVANGVRSHLFYVGDGEEPINFKNFELSLDVQTYPLANSGIYFHTALQKEGWLEQGYELQVNSTHHGEGDYKEVKKSGSLYGVRNLYKAFTKDSVWYNFNLRVAGNHIQIKIDDQLVVDYVEPNHPAQAGAKKNLSSGAFALQGHDPKSTVFFKNIKLKVLPDSPEETFAGKEDETASQILHYQANHIAFIDQHIHADGAFNIDSAMAAFYQTGINLGLVATVDSSKNNSQLLSHIRRYSPLPVFLGIYRKDLQSMEAVPATTLSQFDYVIGDITTFKNAKGQMVDVLKTKDIGDKQAFMDDYVKAITEGLDKGGLDIWAIPTLLPEVLSSEYDALWTDERMSKVIDAAHRNNVAIEVYNPSKIPSLSFLKLAKEKGCTFSVGGLFVKNKMSSPDYFFEVIDQCKLDYKDIFIPGNPNQ
jgi:hypothetical protein